MIAVLVLLMVGVASGSVFCPDENKCQDKNTCCPTNTGYACCQYPNAVCCTDKAHCCPQGYQCDLETQLCEKKGLPWYRIPLSPQIPAKEEKRAAVPLVISDDPSVSVVHCDNVYVCPDSTTCCRAPSGRWYCCPYSMGQCCPDGIHCCRHGYHCDSTSTRCLQGELSIPSSPQISAMERNTIQEEEKRVPASLVKTESSVVHCDNVYVCPDSTTCCRAPSGRWYCCPYSMGQCCPDGVHCCPHGYHCDSTSTLCSQGELSIPSSRQISAMERNTIQEEEKRVPASLVKTESSVVHCDNVYVCPDSTTCCRAPSGRWYCCPYSMGQCCRDGIHCCRHGYHCDSTSTRCLQGELSIPSSPQIAAIERNTIQIPAEEEEERAAVPLVISDDPSVSVVHCDNVYVCPDSTTCCRAPSGRWYCCPYSMGQCCPDGVHCCPHGYHCDSTSTLCSQGELSIPSSRQISAMERNSIQEEEKRVPASLVKTESSVVHCDNVYVCPDSTTCCRAPSGRWYCCLYSMGQCCPDGVHCCPHGYHCDSTSTLCSQGELSIPSSPQISAMERNTIQDQCCQSETGCCPIGFHCAEESKACVRDYDAL